MVYILSVEVLIVNETSGRIINKDTVIAKQPEFRKYLPLDEYFGRQPATTKEVKLTFDEVEAILGSPLPKSATPLNTWWTNVQPKIQSHRTAWLNHGWVVSEFDLEARRVKFVRAQERV